jgi:hypothetical protein
MNLVPGVNVTPSIPCRLDPGNEEAATMGVASGN